MARKSRVRLYDETPILPKPVVGWIYNHSRRHYWRVAGWYELDDLIQDGLMKAYQCLERYGTPGIDLDPPHFMRLVQTSFRNHMGDLIRKKRAVDDRCTKFADMSATKSDTQMMDLVAAPSEALQEFVLLVAELPVHLRKAVLLMFTDKGAEALRRLRVRLDGVDETLSDKLRKLTGFPAGKDFESELRSYLWERESELV